MSVLLADGFAFYGTGATSRTNMLQGLWAEFTATSVSASTANPRGDGTHHLRWTNSAGVRARRVFGSTETTYGCGFAIYLSELPESDSLLILHQGRDGANAAQWSMTCTTTGKIRIHSGTEDGSEIAITTDNVLVAGAYQHVEFRVFVDNAGTIEVRVNGESVLSASGIDTRFQGTAGCEQFVIGTSNGGDTLDTWDVADLCVWDTSGGINDDFLGDVQWLPRYPNADEVASAWTRNTGATDFSTIIDVTPDADTTYIAATLAAQVSEFALADLPANTSDVIAVVTQPMMRKTDAGAGSVQVSMLSANVGSPPAPAVSAGDDNPMTTVYTYYADVFDADPATGVRWTLSSYNAARLRLTRTL